jgi:hypothetical protein
MNQITPENYRSYPAINYSLLAKLDRSPRTVLQEEKSSEALSFGSLVDCLLTSPEEVDKRFIKVPESAPTGQLLTYTEYLAGLYELSDDAYNQAYVVSQAKKDSPEKMKEKFDLIGKPYYDFLKSSNDKMVIPREMWMRAETASNTLKTHEFTQRWFSPGYEEEILYQLPIAFKADVLEYKDVEFKCLLDLIKVDHLTKTIRPRDIKTTSESIMYWYDNSFFKWKYYLQAALYHRGVLAWRDANYPDYSVDGFGFIVINSQFPTNPLCFETSPTTLSKGWTGFYDKEKGYRGVAELASDLLWHKQYDLWEYPKSAYEAKGVFII